MREKDADVGLLFSMSGLMFFSFLFSSMAGGFFFCSAHATSFTIHLSSLYMFFSSVTGEIVLHYFIFPHKRASFSSQ